MSSTNKNKDGLTPLQERFVEEYLVDLDAGAAAIRAGYSKRTAYSSGPRLLKAKEYPAVAAAIARAQAERSERTKIDADWVLKRLADEVMADVADLFDESGALKAVNDWPLIWRQGLIAGIDIDEIKIDGVAIGNTKKLKLSDRIRRIELIGKHIDIRAFAERREITGKDGGPVEVVDADSARREIEDQFAQSADEPAGSDQVVH